MAEMQKQGKPTDDKQDEWHKDLHPEPNAGLNVGLEGTHPEKESGHTAYHNKDIQCLLAGYSDDELKQIPVLPPGSRLEQGAKYIDLNDAERQEFTAMGGMEAGENNYYVPKTEVSYQLWNRLREVANPARQQAGESNLT